MLKIKGDQSKIQKFLNYSKMKKIIKSITANMCSTADL